MTLNVNDAKTNTVFKDRPQPEEGTHLGVVIQVIDLGVQPGPVFQGEKKPDAQMVRLTYELPNETHDFDGEIKPLIVSEEFKFSGDDRSKCFKRLNALDPGMKKTGGDLMKLLGMPCMVQIIQKDGKGKHEGKKFSNVGSIAPLMKGMAAPESTFNGLVAYTPSMHVQDVWDSLPEFLQNKISSRLDASGESQTSAKQESPSSSDNQVSDDW